MRWNGEELVYKDDYARAMLSLCSPADVTVFKNAFSAYFPKYPEQIMGYLTGEMEPERAIEVRKMMGIVHPLNPENKELSIKEMFEAGYRLGKEGVPEWMEIALMIPRKTFEPIKD